MSTPGFRIISWTQRWEWIDGAWYRNALAIRLEDGARRIVAVLDEVAA